MKRLAPILLIVAMLVAVVISVLNQGKEPTSVQGRARAERARSAP